MTRKALGRGLGALLSAEGAATAYEETTEIPLDLIDPGALQPRIVFDQAKLDELAKSILANGVVQPILVRRKDDRFEIIAGERRSRAAQIAGLTKIPALVRNVSDDQVLEIALIENIQREDLNPIEEARAYKKLIEALGLTQETVGERVGRDRSYITNYLRLLKLPEGIQELLQSGRISTGHARTLLGVDQPDVQRRIARRIIDQGLSVRATEQLIKLAGMRPGQGKGKRQTLVAENDANIRAAESRLRRRFGTKVKIIQEANSHSGRIELEFYGQPDLIRLYSLLAPGQDTDVPSTAS
jgi:ParB family chromosome partitioning protein